MVWVSSFKDELSKLALRTDYMTLIKIWNDLARSRVIRDMPHLERALAGFKPRSYKRSHPARGYSPIIERVPIGKKDIRPRRKDVSRYIDRVSGMGTPLHTLESIGARKIPKTPTADAVRYYSPSRKVLEAAEREHGYQVPQSTMFVRSLKRRSKSKDINDVIEEIGDVAK
jgi:hypothetical protein